MTKLLVQQHNSKFIQNIIYSKINNTDIIGAVLNNNLYQIYYTHKPTHVIFCADNLTPETIQFISDFGNNTDIKCFLYHNRSISEEIYTAFKTTGIIHICDEKYSGKDECQLLCPNNLINSQIFNNGTNTNESIVCFLDDYNELPSVLQPYLYPNTKMPIKLFNAPDLKHYQNLGLLDELTRANVLKSTKYFLSLGSSKNDYSLEAQSCGCIILSIADLKEYTSIQYKAPGPVIDYATFITESILS